MASRRLNHSAGAIATKPWPNDPTKPVDIGDLTKPLISLVRQGYAMKRRSKAALRFNGFDTGPSIAHVILPVADTISPEGLADAKDRGDTLLDIVIFMAVRAGVEQGYRMAQHQIEQLKIIARAYEKEMTKKKSKIGAKKKPPQSGPSRP